MLFTKGSRLMRTSLTVALLCAFCASSSFAKELELRGPTKNFLTHVVWPKYPYEARVHKITGRCVVRMKINAGGSVEKAEIGKSSGSPILDRAAVDACKQWRFKPELGIHRAIVPISFVPWETTFRWTPPR
jgi:TonB family protein